jgi:hypothetical protein
MGVIDSIGKYLRTGDGDFEVITQYTAVRAVLAQKKEIQVMRLQ